MTDTDATKLPELHAAARDFAVCWNVGPTDTRMHQELPSPEVIKRWRVLIAAIDAQAGRTKAVGVREELAGRLESLAEILTTDPAITDTIWARDGVTLYEALGEVADDIRQMPAHEAPKITDERVTAFREAAFHTYGHCDIRAGLTAALAQPTAMAKPENGCPKCGSETCDGMCDCYLDESAAAQPEPTGADAVEGIRTTIAKIIAGEADRDTVDAGWYLKDAEAVLAALRAIGWGPK